MRGPLGYPCTDANGFYTATVDYGFSGTVAPTKTGYAFTPTKRVYSNVTTDWLNQDYEAIPVGLPLDNFNDNRRGATWRISTDGNTSIIEDVNRLNVISIGGFDMAAYCVGHWKMNDNAANTDVLDGSGNGHNGTFNDATGNPNTSAHHIVGKIDGALIFDGTNDYVAFRIATVWILQAH